MVSLRFQKLQISRRSADDRLRTDLLNEEKLLGIANKHIVYVTS